jgi:inner membrane protein
MASLFSHAALGLSLGSAFYRPGCPKRIWIAGAFCSVLPAIDVIGFRFGIPYSDFWGHRGFTHSLLFALATAVTVGLLICKSSDCGIQRAWVVFYLFLATASHGLLDAMTNGGLGVAFFSPFNNQRYFLPWRPIRVSPISVGRFFGARGLVVLKSELVWVLIPALLFAGLVSAIFANKNGGVRLGGPQMSRAGSDYWAGFQSAAWGSITSAKAFSSSRRLISARVSSANS